ncbi:Helicase conserved C-terminal domain-containing protein [Methanococcoides vulcani]|uniref:Helicase conserved C-terminal domain-containing protein n=1 Tax=Methanococcoides vulcani TaxID=1353158 RepID=A0A1I0AAS1_9EURY|nr:DEAD/DEAH box helicase [Methanococcoides vulcani]SES91257.1 Helicase conserved C-terminal domain-containing protein [Methanococcoides vulcani]
MIDILTQDKFASDLSHYIISKVSGTHLKDETVSEKPSRMYLVGTLAARKSSDDKVEDEKAASIRASKLKVSFLVKNNKIQNKPKITINALGNVYYNIKNISDAEENFGPNSTKQGKQSKNLWKRLPFSNTYKIDLSTEKEMHLDFFDVREKANSDPLIIRSINDNLWAAKVSVKISEFDDENKLITLSYENTGKELVKDESSEKASDSTKKNAFENTLFDCRLEVDIDNLSTEEFVDNYSYEGHKQRYFYDFRTMNCQASWVDEQQNKFVTDHFARFEQKNILPRSNISNLNLTFSNLMELDTSIGTLDAFVSEMKKYNEIYKNNIPSDVSIDEFEVRKSNENRQSTWGERIFYADNFEKLIARVEKGIELIKSSKDVQQSFLKTNKTFNNYYSTKNPSVPNAGWRLFQLAFFLSSIESISEETDLDTTDVLHVDTGGGKSEAYFALVIFTSFYERITGKIEGVSAIVKFPLRMLSIQQLERIASIIIHAEEIRKQNNQLFPGVPFSLGYYVGSKSDDFPDLYSKVRNNLYDHNKIISPAPISSILSICPLCSSNSKGNIQLKEDSAKKTIIHQCDNCNKQFSIYQSDREIFRWRPTVIVSTVDKWASLSQQRRARNLLGGAGSMCPDNHGFIPSGDKCEDKKEEEFQCTNIGEFTPSMSGPRLSIQDEMHLLKEGFGTISSHFEGLIEAIVEERSGRKMKHIAMSATLNGAEKQIKELYNKKFFVIPGRCPEGAGSENDFFFEQRDGPKRIIYGLKPNLRDNHYASLRTLLHYAEFIITSQKELNSNSSKFCAKYGITNSKEAQKLLNHYLVPLTYHIKKQDVYDMGRLKDAVVNDALKKNEFNNSDIQGIVLTGDSELEDLKKAIDKVRDFVFNYNPSAVDMDGIQFEPIYSNSVVSHGVDLDELNFMVFQGLPYSTSEYIQALSRVGRKHLGMILLWFYPNRVRDESFYRNFNRYHNSLDHEVRPIPINRFSKLGLLQTMNSVFCAGILNYLSNEKGKPLYKKKDILNLKDDDIEELINFIYNVYGDRILDIDVRTEVEERLNEIKLGKDKEDTFFPNILTKTGHPYYRTQSGMRGMQKNVALELNNRDKMLLDKMEV